MGKPRPRSFEPPSSGARSDRVVVGDRRSWCYTILTAALAILTCPLWFFQPAPALGTPDQSRAAGTLFWLGLGVIAGIAGRRWGFCLTLDTERRTVARECRGPWRTTVHWSFAGEHIEAVWLLVDAEGITWLQVSPRRGAPFLIQSGPDAATLRKLGEAVAACWDVPFRGMAWGTQT